ncbi:hypothetical protein C2845_PM13G02880 [Panicum miliaceum]|uniref:DUF4220 domain-containing protein n=1 Tax=Panicum miliaceum TaxID=4540 RepID=A0A3L6RG45_PANMI|nr:hypothetical protein C2845_PM13G02880 [Panicum miliaceum]
MDLSRALQWWEEWQLRVLVLGSLSVQCHLAFFAGSRKTNIRPVYRFFIWLSYVGGETVTIYALATLFNRQKKRQYHSGSNVLELLWVPILLMHLGGQISISAYNIEDNELWRRHILTAVTQVTVALYVFCRSWSSSADQRLLLAAILLFILGVFKCFKKPLALKRASFNSIVNNFHSPAQMTTENREVELEKYIQEARDFVQLNKQDPQTSDSNGVSFDKKITTYEHRDLLSKSDKLFVDYAYVYHDRLTKLKSLWLLDKENTYDALCVGLSKTFNLIYSRLFKVDYYGFPAAPGCRNHCSSLVYLLNHLLLPIVPIGLFHISHKEAYKGSDIKVTFLLLYITYLLEISATLTTASFYTEWSDRIAQHNLIAFLASNRRHSRLMGIAEFLQCKGLLDTYFCLKPCYSSKDITMLVRSHVKNGWLSHIVDIESYWRFSDTRGHWALERHGCEGILWSAETPFDESIILWHVATDLCFYSKGTCPPDSECARLCRQISNYMMHLLFTNPEMLLPGCRRNLFIIAYGELKAILQGDDDSTSPLDEHQLTQRIFSMMESKEGFVHKAWELAQELMQIVDEKMWEVIKDVWIEMLCFSAGRCRGYLHAKSLGYGGEYLSFVTLLMSHAGLETSVERQQRVQLRLPKQERVRIAKERVQEAASSNQGGTDQSTPQGMVAVKEEENAATPPAASEACSGLAAEQEERAPNASASQHGECVAPAVEIVVAP